MSGIFSKDWLAGVRDWATTTAQGLTETVLFGRKTGALATEPPPTKTPGFSFGKWLPYGLIGAALLGALFFWKKKK